MGGIVFDLANNREELIIDLPVTEKYGVLDIYEYAIHEQTLFKSFCDFMQLDFVSIRADLGAITEGVARNGLGKKELSEIIMYLISKHNYFKNSEFIRRLVKATDENDFYSLWFNSIHIFSLIQDYVNKALNDSQLYNCEVFELYIYRFAGLQAPRYVCVNQEDYEKTKKSFMRGPGTDIRIDHKTITAERTLDDFFSHDWKTHIGETSFLKGYFTTSLSVEELCVISLYEIISGNYIIKKCANCDKFFVALKRSDTLYCDRVSPQDDEKTCKEYGSNKAYLDNLKNDKAAGLYRRIYMQKQMAAKRNADIPLYRTDFEEFKLQSKSWKKELKSGIKSYDEYLNWLKSIKRRDDD